MLLSALVLFIANILRTQGSVYDVWNHTTVDFSDGWTDEKGSAVSPAALNESENHPVGQKFSIYKKIPSNTKQDMTLMFRSIGLCFTVSVDNMQLYSFGIEDFHVFGNSPGSAQHQINIPSELAGRSLCITCATSYNAYYEKIADLTLGNGMHMLRNFFSQNAFALIMCVVLFTIGIIYILLDFPISVGVSKSHSLRYLGIFSLITSTWSATETHIPDYFISNPQALNCFSLALLSLVSIPLGLFLENSFPLQYTRLLRVGYILSVTNYVICLALYLGGVADYNQSLSISHSVIAYFLVLTVFTIASNIRTKQCEGYEKWLLVSGFSFISVCVLIDLIASKLSYLPDNSRFTRVGMLVVVICSGMVICLQTIQHIKKAGQLEVISQLAYKDGLTGIGNRTAFNERVETCAAIHQESLNFSVVMFDVNNLKLANDKYGHQIGDLLIQGASEVIKKAFSDTGDVYRIGGDEFAVIAIGLAQSSCLDVALEKLNKYIDAFNLTKTCPAALSIACGYACSQGLSDTISSMISVADKRMYDNKRRMKSAASEAIAGV